MRAEKLKKFYRTCRVVARSEWRAGKKNVGRLMRHIFEGQDRMIWRPENYSHNPVFTLHGYLQGEASMMGLADFLSRNGYNVDNTPYPFYRDLQFVEQRLAWRIKRAREITGRKVDIIGHSTGAVMSLALARRVPEDIDRVIALGLPEKGSEFALVISFLPSGRQLFPRHRYMKKMIDDSFPPGVSLYLIQGEGDILVPRKFYIFPEGGSNITKIMVKHTGHLGLIEEEVFPLILQILKGGFPGGEGVIEYAPERGFAEPPEKKAETGPRRREGLWGRLPFPLSTFFRRWKARLA